MSEKLKLLVEQLSLEKIDDNIFRGKSKDPGWGRVFGGQVLGQAISAATQTVPPDRFVHSFHSYFLLPGAVEHPIIFLVENVRDGGSFTTRHVKAIQHGKQIFIMTASFQLKQQCFHHQDPMPDGIPQPEDLKPLWQLARENQNKFPSYVRSYFTEEAAIDQRPITFRNPFDPVHQPPSAMRWVRANGNLSDDLNIHRYLLAYSSDYLFLDVSLQPHGVSWVNPELQVCSLDHTMRFHRDFRFDDWLLFVVHSPNMSRARGLVLGQVFNRNGDLVASASQEGLVRRHT